MTLEEAQRVAKVAMTADSGCPACVSAMAHELVDEFPEFRWVLDEDEYEYEIKVEVK